MPLPGRVADLNLCPDMAAELHLCPDMAAPFMREWEGFCITDRTQGDIAVRRASILKLACLPVV